MSETECGAVREQIPDVGAGRSDEGVVALVESHVAGCSECAAELELVRVLYASRARAPEGLSESVTRRLRQERRPDRRPWWGISAAAVAALALGIGLTARPTVDPAPGEGVEMVVEADDEYWLSDDGILAGAPVFEALSDETLAELLDELSTLQGGRA